MEKRAQISVEYLMIISIAMTIIISGIVIFREYIFESNDLIIQRRLDDISNSILTKSAKMYYYGISSKSTLDLDFPPGIMEMFILYVPSSEEYFLVFNASTTSGITTFMYDASVPLARSGTPCEPISLCLYPNKCDCLPGNIFSKGRRSVEVKANESTCYLSSGGCIAIGVPE